MNDEPDRPPDEPGEGAGGSMGERESADDALPFDASDFDGGVGGHDPLDPDADPFKPPAIPTEVCCLHCGREYQSYLIEWRVMVGRDGKPHGYWCCPTPGCDGAGFGFDLFPTDPDYVGEDGEPMAFFADDEEGWDEADEADGLDGEAWAEDLPPTGDDGEDRPFDDGSDIPY